MRVTASLVPTQLSRLVHRHLFLLGARWGALSFAVGAAVALAWPLVRRERPRRLLPIWGPALVVPVLLALPSATRRPGGLVVALVLLAIAGAVGDLAAGVLPGGVAWGALFGLPGAWVLAWHAGLAQRINEKPASGLGWVQPAVLAAAVVGGAALASFDAEHRRQAWAPALVAVAALGLYGTVPDTEQALVLCGAALPVALLGWPLCLASLGAVGAMPVGGLVAWVAAYEGRGRPGSVVAAVLCLGLLLAEPAGRCLRRLAGRAVASRAKGWAGVAEAASVVGVQVVLVLAVSRIGHRGGAGHVALLAGTLVAAVAVAVALVGRPGGMPEVRSAHLRGASRAAREGGGA